MMRQINALIASVNNENVSYAGQMFFFVSGNNSLIRNRGRKVL